MRYAYLLVATLAFGCSKSDETQVQADTVFTSPFSPLGADTITAVVPDSTGLVIDRARLRSAEHDMLLDRFAPLQVRDLYAAFRPHRKVGITSATVDSFTAAHKITRDELRAILTEGDLLGWNRAK